jgi:hypothetical protein
VPEVLGVGDVGVDRARVRRKGRMEKAKSWLVSDPGSLLA